jgi:serine/threonine-protein kinase
MITERVPPPSALRPDLPKWIDVVLGRALAKSPADRYESMAHFARRCSRRRRQRDSTLV